MQASPSEALYVYRNKELIEKSFGNLKNRLNMRRLLVISSENLEGKLMLLRDTISPAKKLISAKSQASKKLFMNVSAVKMPGML